MPAIKANARPLDELSRFLDSGGAAHSKGKYALRKSVTATLATASRELTESKLTAFKENVLSSKQAL